MGVKMKIKVVVALGVVLVLGAVAWGQGARIQCLLGGNDYLKFPAAFQLGYTSGAADGILMMRDKTYNADIFHNYAREMTAAQIKAVVDKYMKDNPQEWHLGMATLVYVSVIRAGLKAGGFEGKK